MQRRGSPPIRLPMDTIAALRRRNACGAAHGCGGQVHANHSSRCRTTVSLHIGYAGGPRSSTSGQNKGQSSAIGTLPGSVRRRKHKRARRGTLPATGSPSAARGRRADALPLGTSPERPCPVRRAAAARSGFQAEELDKRMTKMIRMHVIRTAIEVCLFPAFLFLLGALPGLLSDRDSTASVQQASPAPR